VPLGGVGISALGTPVALGAAIGLFVGKLVGIFSLTMLAVKLRLAPMPGGAPGMKLLGVASVAGVGFTVALFIATLAFSDAPKLLDQAKLGILVGSSASALVGYTVLRFAGSYPQGVRDPHAPDIQRS